MEQSTPNTEKISRKRGGGLVGGLILVMIGIYALLSQYTPLNLGNLALPSLGLVFIVAAFANRTRGFLIPGGILTGLGAGVLLTETYPFPEDQKGGIFLLAFAGGWLLISLLNLIMNWMEGTQRKWIWWPLIPAAVMAFVGLPLVLGGEALKILQMYSLFWPIILILLGLFIILRRRN